jgi:hypothetical protein
MRARNLDSSTTRFAGTSSKRVRSTLHFHRNVYCKSYPTDYIATEQLLDNTPLIENLRYSGTN